LKCFIKIWFRYARPAPGGNRGGWHCGKGPPASTLGEITLMRQSMMLFSTQGVEIAQAPYDIKILTKENRICARIELILRVLT
jgi:hypothetical protein